MGTNATWNRAIYPKGFEKNRKPIKKIEASEQELLEKLLKEVKAIKKLLKGGK
jgi:hypothetical protein